MAPRITETHIAEQLGALRENMERGREDRQDLKEQLQGVKHALNGLQQSAITTNGVLAELAKQNLGERVSQLENRYNALSGLILSPEECEAFRKIKESHDRWNSWIGSGRAFLVKATLGFLTCSAVAGAVVALIANAFGVHMAVR